MAVIKPFRCVRPAASKARQTAALPYDVYNRAEARAEVEKKPQTFLANDRSHTAYPETVGS